MPALLYLYTVYTLYIVDSDGNVPDQNSYFEPTRQLKVQILNGQSWSLYLSLKNLHEMSHFTKVYNSMAMTHYVHTEDKTAEALNANKCEPA